MAERPCAQERPALGQLHPIIAVRLRPFPDIPRHVVQANLVRRIRFHRGNLCESVLARVLFRKLPLPDVGKPFAIWLLLAPPNVGCPIRPGGRLPFLGGWLAPFPNAGWLNFLDVIPGWIWFLLKTFIFLYVFLWVRATLPRYRYDQLMRLGWKVLIPVAIANVIATGIVKVLL